MKLDAKAFSLACAIFWSLSVFLFGIFAMNGYTIGIVDLLGSGYIGFSATVTGSIIGAVWGFVDGLICGWIFAWLYNTLAK